MSLSHTDALNHQQQQNSDSNPSPLAMNSQNNSTANTPANNGSQQQNENGSNGSNGNTSQTQSSSQTAGQGNYYYRDTQPLKLETYPDLPLQCYQAMEDEESEPEVE